MRVWETEAKPPTRKSTLIMAASGMRVVTASDRAFKMAFTATPAKITVVREAPVRWPMNTTRSMAAMAPAKAPAAMDQPEMAPQAQHRVTASPAPALTPMMLGEARRLCSTL